MSKEANKIEVKKIVLKLKDKEVSLSVEDAKELKQVLDNLFGYGTTAWVPTYPVYIPSYTSKWEHWTTSTYMSDGTYQMSLTS